MTVQRTLENDEREDQRAKGLLGASDAVDGYGATGSKYTRGRSKADGRTDQKIDLETGDSGPNKRVNQKRIPRIYDVDESMSLQKMARKSKAPKRTMSEDKLNDDQEEVQQL